jgi:hypothetical protein
MSKLFSTNKLSLNLDTTHLIKFVTQISQYPLMIWYNDKYIEEAVNTKSLGLQIGNHLNRRNHIHQLVPELNPCGGGVEYLHREPASRKRRRNGTKKGRAIA